MKKSKLTKALLMTLCAVLLVVGSVLGTLAYLTDRSSVENTFTVGNVDITVDESDVNEDGEQETNPETGETLPRVEGNEYHLIPGETYLKDPTMTVVKGSEESYVRMLVTVHGIQELTAAFGTEFNPATYIDGWDETKWIYNGPKKVDLAANTVTYEFRYYQTVDAYEAEEDIVLEPLFTAFSVPGEVTGEQLAQINGTFKIVVEGHAIQVASFEADGEKTAEDVAWEAFDAQYTNP